MIPSELHIQHRFTTINGLKYHYVEKGTGPLVVLLHGFPENWWTWRYQFDALVEKGFRVVAPDQRGYNDTDKSGPYSLETLSSDVVALIRSLGEEKAHLVGHDWGGAVAFHVAGRFPQHVDKLVVLGAPHPAMMTKALFTRHTQLLKSWYMLFFQLPFLPDHLLGAQSHHSLPFLYRKGALDPSHFGVQEVQPFVDGARREGAARAMLGWYRAMFLHLLRNRGKTPQLPTIPADTLMIWSKHDLALGYDELVPGTERYVPNLKVETLDNAGHFMHAERPELVNRLLLSFLPENKVTVFLSDVGDNKITVIKEIRAITGLDMKDARELVETAPKAIKERASLQEAERIQRVLVAAGAKVELRLR
ncbi:MAG: ribosomal protein L7/L12 [Myxococcaceae bacterium]